MGLFQFRGFGFRVRGSATSVSAQMSGLGLDR